MSHQYAKRAKLEHPANFSPTACTAFQIQYLVWQHLWKHCHLKFVAIKNLRRREKWLCIRRALAGVWYGTACSIYRICRWTWVQCLHITLVYLCKWYSRGFYNCLIKTMIQYTRAWYIRGKLWNCIGKCKRCNTIHFFPVGCRRIMCEGHPITIKTAGFSIIFYFSLSLYFFSYHAWQLMHHNKTQNTSQIKDCGARIELCE